MSNNYRFYVEAMTGDAIVKLEEINKLMDKIESKSAKGTQNFFHTTQKGIDENISDMQRIIQIKKELDSAFEKDVNMFGKSGSMEGVIKSRKNLEDLQDTFREVQSQFSKMANMKANPNFVNQSTLRTQKAYRDELTETEKSLQRIKRETQEVVKLESRVRYRASSAVATGRMNHTQANTFRKDTESVGDLRATQQNNATKKGQLRSRFEQDTQSLNELRQNVTMDRQVRKNQETALQERIKGTEKEIDALNKLDDTIERVVENINKATSEVSSGGVQVNARKDSFLDIMSSRAPSIAMASIGAFAGAITSLYQRGATANAGMRDASVSIGQRTGSSDFRALRKEMQYMGIERNLGYKGAEMQAFQESALSGIGNHKDLSGTTKALAEGSRAVPVDNETLSSFMSNAMKSGSVSNKDQVKAIQEGFLGAIQQSGMAGREKEQLEALASISDNLFTGRNGSNEELKNALAIQTMFAQSGDRALQGENGAQAINGINDGLLNAVNDPTRSKILGMGTRFQGLNGKWDLTKIAEKGIGSSPELLKDVMDWSKVNSNSADGQMQAFREFFGNSLTTDQTEAIFKATDGGKNLNKETLKQLQDDGVLDGADKYLKNATGYTESSEAIDNQSDAVTEKMASEVHDAGQFIREANTALKDVNGTMYALIGALLASSIAISGSGAMSVGSQLIKKFTTSTYGSGGVGGSIAKGAGGAVDDVVASFTAGKMTGGLKGGLKGATGTAKEFLKTQKGYAGMAYQQGGVKGLLKQGGNFLGDLFGGGGAVGATDDIVKGASKSAGLLSKGGKLLGKMATPIMAVGELFNIATAKDKVKATGEGVGAIGGALGGASIGATIGSAVPIVGTAIGGAIGGVVGGIAGSGLGRKVGGGVVDVGRSAWKGIKGFFGGEEAEASEIEQGAGTKKTKAKEKKASSKEEKDTVSKKATAEKKREANNSKESANMSLYEKLLTRAEQILNKARSQNGIFGNSSSGSSSSSSPSSNGNNGSLSTLGDNKKWTSTDIQQHDLGSTVGGLTAEQLDAWIANTAPAGSPMRGMGSLFLQAGQESGLDPRYLVAHSAVETGWGTSNLSLKGDKEKGNWFGIGAYDDNPDNGYNYGLGLVGGAKWIAENYYKNGQKNLHDMVNDSGGHNYATDPNWASQIASIMGGSDKYTTGQAQTFKSENNVTVNVTGASAQNANLKELGTKVGKVMTDTMSDSALFFAKEMKRV